MSICYNNIILLWDGEDIVENLFFEESQYYDLLLKDVLEEKSKIDEKERFKIISILVSLDNYYIYDFLENLHDVGKKLSNDEMEYIKCYFLKYRLYEALKLKKLYPDVFSEEDNKYLLCACLENKRLAKSRLTYNFEEDNKEIVKLLVDKVIVSFNDLTGLSSYTDNELLQDVLFEKYKNNFDYFRHRFYLLNYESKLFKKLFLHFANDKKIIKYMIDSEIFLKLDDHEKMIFHDLFYEKIWSRYIRSSSKRKNLYIKQYKKYLLESEMMKQIVPFYKKDNIEEINDCKSNYHYTKNMIDYDEAFNVKIKIMNLGKESNGKMSEMAHLKSHIAMCDCHKKIIRYSNEEDLKTLLNSNITCSECNTTLKYKGEYLTQAENIIDEKFTEQPIIIANDKKEKTKITTMNKKEKMTKELAISKKLIFENGLPYLDPKKDTPTYGAIINAIKFAIDDNNIDLLNNIFIKYDDVIQTNVAKYINNKQKKYIKINLGIDL